MPSFWAELATIEGRKWAEISSFMHEATLASIRRLNLSTVSQFQITYGNMKCTTYRAAVNVLHFIFHSNVIYNYVLDTIHWNPVFDCISPHYPRPWVILSIEAHLTCISDTTENASFLNASHQSACILPCHPSFLGARSHGCNAG